MRKRKIFLSAGGVWILTALLGSAFHVFTHTLGLSFPGIFALSLAGSIPAALFLIPNVFVLESMIGILTKTIYAGVSVAILCGLVIVTFMIITKGYPFDPGMRTRLLLPYIISAEVSFFCVCRGMILSKNNL
jgi:hypothetical protein